MALFRGFPRQKYSPSFNVKENKNRIQIQHFSGAFYFGIPIVGLGFELGVGFCLGLGLGLGLVLGLGLGLGLGLELGLGLGLGLGLELGLGLGLGLS